MVFEAVLNTTDYTLFTTVSVREIQRVRSVKMLTEYSEQISVQSRGLCATPIRSEVMQPGEYPPGWWSRESTGAGRKP